jgi:hypothetical protein
MRMWPTCLGELGILEALIHIELLSMCHGKVPGDSAKVTRWFYAPGVGCMSMPIGHGLCLGYVPSLTSRPDGVASFGIITGTACTTPFRKHRIGSFSWPVRVVVR